MDGLKLFLENNAQLFILLLGTLGMLMVSIKSRWGIFVMLLAQPFWLTTTFIHDQWGMFYNAVGYTVSLLIGIYFWFYPKKRWVGVIEINGFEYWMNVAAKDKDVLDAKINSYLGNRGTRAFLPLDEVKEMSTSEFEEKLSYLRRIIQTDTVQ